MKWGSKITLTILVLLIQSIFLLAAGNLFAQEPTSEQIKSLKEQIKKELLMELRGEEPPAPEPLSPEWAQVKDQIKRELKRELTAEGDIPKPQPTEGKNFQTQVRDAVLESLGGEESAMGKFLSRFEFGMLLEFGAVFEKTEFNDGSKEDRSAFAMTTVEVALAVQLADWANGEVALLYEDPTFDDETSLDVDVAALTIGNTEKFPAYLKAGAFYVPFGALYTHFPDDPLIDAPLTLLLGESREKAVLGGVEYAGFSLSGYAFNGDVDKAGEDDDHIENFGFDGNYTWESEQEGGLAITVGASYINNITEADNITDSLNRPELENRPGGFDAYLHAQFFGFFALAEYMASLVGWKPVDEGDQLLQGKKPTVWNIEAGYNWNWWRNLEIALKYAGSNDGGGLGFPEYRFGIDFNQELYDGLVVSLGYLYDKYHDDDVDERDHRNLVFSQLAFEF